MHVPAAGSLAVEGGVIVHNCGDETRYRLRHVPRVSTSSYTALVY